jgi:superfamily I DNA and/or RNA helicase
VNAGPRIFRNLNAMMHILDGKGQPKNAAIALAAWQTLFLEVPVVSTTFAFVGRMFNGLNRESLGWLLVDEAGRAAPQNATGALWRCRRAVIVGDPL